MQFKINETMIKQKIKDFYYRELNEIREHKTRLGAIMTSLVASLMIFTFTSNEEDAKITSDTETPKAVVKTDNKAKNNETNSKLTRIAGLEKASEGVELINPFKVDVKESQVAESKSENKPVMNAPAFNPPKPTAPIKADEPFEKIILTLKGTAISGDKKMAIIQRSTVDKNNSKNSKTSKDNSKQESFILSLGDEVDGRKIIDIDKFSVTFDDGYRLYIQEAVQ